MSKDKAPGVIPEWKEQFAAMSPAEQAEIAVRIKVSPRTVWNWANGKSTPTRASAEAIKRAFKRMGGRA